MKEKYIKLNSFITVTVSISIVLVLSLISYNFFMQNFESIEKEQNTKNIYSALDIMNKKLSYMEGIVNDYAKWDDTYNFLKDKNEEYIYENFREGTNTLGDIGVDFAIFVSLENEIFYTSNVEREAYKFDESFIQNILEKFKGEEDLTTVFKSGLNNFYLIKKYISNSDDTAPKNGFIYAGKLVSTPTLTSIKKVFHRVSLEDSVYKENDLILDSKYLKNVAVKFLESKNCNCLENVIQLHDDNKNYVFSIVTQSQRDLINKGKETILYYNILISIFLFIVLFLIFRNQRSLEKYNKKLEKRVHEVVSSLREKDQILFQQSKLASMGEMIGNIAHQWRQPLNSLGLLIQKIEIKYHTNSLDKESLEDIVTRSKLLTNNMSETIDDFMSFFNPGLKDETFFIDEVIKKSLNLFDSKDMKCEIKLINEVSSNKELSGSKNGLIQVILNLLTNACDSMKDKSFCQIDLIIKEDANSIFIIVRDYGDGIKKEIFNRIFEPYFTTKFKSQGTGIGLYMSKMIIEQYMNGTLSVKNNKEGATFTIELKYK